jgi:pteridine reductase
VIAHDLAKGGWDVAIHFRRSAQEAAETVAELRALGVAADAFQADVAIEADVDRLFAEVLARFGRLDVLVNTASKWAAQRLEEVTAEDVRQHFAVDALGTFLCARRGGLIMAGQPEGGAIVNFGDWAVSRPYRDHAAYFIAKGAIPTLTRVLAVELAHRNPRVRVNCVQPGPVMFPPELSPAEQQELVEATLVKMADCPQSVSHAVRFLIDNPFVTGECLTVDGGRTIFAGE